MRTRSVVIILLMTLVISCTSNRNMGIDSVNHNYNGSYSGESLNRIAFPIGGIGSGMYCIEGSGYFSNMSVRHHPDLFKEPGMFAALSIKGMEGGARVLEGPVPDWRKFGTAGAAKGSNGANYGFPRFDKATFTARFPSAIITLSDDDLPVKVNITGWSPFIPGDPDNSSLPVGIIEYSIVNISQYPIETVFSFHSPNFMKVRRIIENHVNPKNGFNIRMKTVGDNSIGPINNGFVLSQEGTVEEPFLKGDFAIFTDQPGTYVDHSWFKGRWFDTPTILWKTIESCKLPAKDSIDPYASGASLYVPLSIKPGESKTVRVFTAWYVPGSDLRIGIFPETPGSRILPLNSMSNTLAGRETFKPRYSSLFNDINEVSNYLIENYVELKSKSDLFSEAFYNTSLPDEIVEAVAANLTILKSPTVLRQDDGRLWGWEGSNDTWGSCYGSCTHVWNYAQSIPHLFPSLERTLRETEFLVSQNDLGQQSFRTNLPISVPQGNYSYSSTSDGQMGGIIKVYRDWRISGDTEWMLGLYPFVKSSIDYSINTWDPKHKGYFEEPHHCTYDIDLWGADPLCTGFYLGGLKAMIEMSKVADEPYEMYLDLFNKGRQYMESELFADEYFIQKIKWKGLHTENPEGNIDNTWDPIEIERFKSEGPKYQYGSGCLSDGVLGLWLASVSGLDGIIDDEKVTSHLESVYKYNLKFDLSDHVNPQRPGFAYGQEGGLLLCTWPEGGELKLPFVYSNEVWTGVEYQVASHLMSQGRVEEGLEIVRTCRDRYDGRDRNPFDEIECGHWYARAMSSYSLLYGLTGIRYDAVDSTLYINSKIGDFTGFISTAKGFGNVGLSNGKPFIKLAYGDIYIKRVLVSEKEMQLE